MTIPVVMGWSGGKDSSLALHALAQDDRYEVVGLLTTMTREYNRVSMHGVRRELILAQADSIGLPLTEVWIRAGADNAAYEAAMREGFEQFLEQGVSTVAFGDLFLEDIRAYRERLVSQIPMTSIYPIWGLDTVELAQTFLASGFRANVCCLDTRVLPESFAGRSLTGDFFQDLPTEVDHCGENGEFHTLVHDGPIFRRPVRVSTSELRRDEPFLFCDLNLIDRS